MNKNFGGIRLFAGVAVVAALAGLPISTAVADGTPGFSLTITGRVPSQCEFRTASTSLLITTTPNSATPNSGTQDVQVKCNTAYTLAAASSTGGKLKSTVATNTDTIAYTVSYAGSAAVSPAASTTTSTGAPLSGSGTGGSFPRTRGPETQSVKVTLNGTDVDTAAADDYTDVLTLSIAAVQ